MAKASKSAVALEEPVEPPPAQDGFSAPSPFANPFATVPNLDWNDPDD